MMYFVSIYMSNELDNPLYVFDSYAEAKKFLLDDVANEKAIAAEGVPIEFTMLNYDSPLTVEDTWNARMTWPSGEFVEWNITTLCNSSKNWKRFADINVTHTDDTVKTVTTTTETESFYEDVHEDDWNFVTCDEITGYVGAWLEADTSDIPIEAVKHLQEAHNICNKMLEVPLESAEPVPRVSELRKTLLKEGVAVNSGEYEKGMLIPMYHGSETVIGGFSQDKMNCGVMGEGVYFTSVFEEACDYAINALDIIEERPGSYLWNGERYEYGCLCEELEEKGYVKSYYLFVEDSNDITHSKYGNGGIVAVARDVRQIFPRNLY